MNNLKIELLTQNWIYGDTDDGMDLCSHGKILLVVDDIVLSDDKMCDWTVASSSLRLMKSAIYGYDSKNEFEIIPCCGYLRMFPSCPNYITWDTKINNDTAIISNIQISKNEKNSLKVINSSIEIDYKEYVRQILKFAEKIIEFYSSCIARKFHDKFDEEEYELFWKEFYDYYQILKEKSSLR